MVRQKNLLRGILFLAVSMLLAWSVISVAFPVYLNTSLLPSLARRIGIENFHSSFFLLGASNTVLDFRVGSADSPALSVSSLALTYSFPDLLRKKIKEVALRGVEIRCRVEGDRLVLADPALEQFLTAKETKGEPEKPGVFFHLERLVIKEATLICRISDQEFRLPFEGNIELPISESNANLQFALNLYPRGHTFKISGHVDMNRQSGRLHLSIKKCNLQRYTDLTGNFFGGDLHGIMGVEADSAFSLLPFSLTDFQATVSLEQARINHVSLFQSSHEKEKKPLLCQMSGKFGNNAWQAGLATAPDQELVAQVAGNSIVMRSPVLEIKGVLLEQGMTMSGFLKTSVNHENHNFKMDLAGLRIDGEALWQDGRPQFQGQVEMSSISFDHFSSEFSFAGGHLALPVYFPFSETSKNGSVGCEKIQFGSRELGSLAGSVTVQGKKMAVKAELLSDLLPDPVFFASFDFISSPDSLAKIKLEVPPFHLTDLSLADFFPDAHNVYFSGLVGGEVQTTLAGSGLQSMARLHLSNGELSLIEHNCVISGLETEVFLSDLEELRSEPAQSLQFSSVKINEMHIDGGQLIFTLENDSFLLEQGNMNWADGTLHFSAVRFRKKQELPEIILYCNRLKLASLLNQFGLKTVEGEGTINGRIPIFFRNGQVSFSDSFLYSTPGREGVLRVGEKGFPTGFIPINAPQFTQLDFVQEALRNFRYNWARLHVISEQNEVVLKLELDGKPAKPLPFVYEAKKGGFVRLPDDKMRDFAQPVRLDVNFRFPLNTFLEYTHTLQEVFE